MPQLQAARQRRVTVWFGHHVMFRHSAAADIAEEYADAMSRRFAGLRVEIDDEPADGLRPLPCTRLWETLTL